MQEVSTPRSDGFSMPAESAPHQGTLMAWPARDEWWGTLPVSYTHLTLPTTPYV